MSYKSEVIADTSGKWCSNALRFATANEAEDHALDLKARWALVIDWRIQKSDEPVNAKWTGTGAAMLALLLALLLPANAHAQSSTVYGADGRAVARTVTGSNGSTTTYDASGRAVARSTTSSSGTTTIYDASGRKAGSIEPQRR